MWNNKLSTFSNDAYFRVEIWELLREIKKELEEIGRSKFPINSGKGGKLYQRLCELQDIFGTAEREGLVLFLDAFPQNSNFKLTVDIMNTNYPKYYRGEKDKAEDWESPTPITFLALENAEFKTYLFIDTWRAKKIETLSKKSIEEILQKASLWLEEGLKEFGIGGKTNVGYGFLEGRG